MASATPDAVDVTTLSQAPIDLEEEYDMSGERRAFVLCVRQDRPGAENELKGLRQFLEELKISVRECIDPENQTIIRALKTFRDEMSPQVSCSFVFIMAHGELGKIFGIDRGTGVKLKTIISLFDNAKCPVLQLKPKVFVIQACRGDHKDPGVTFRSMSQVPVEKKLPTLSDTFIVFPSQPGDVSYRDCNTGSLMITHMMEVFRQFKKSLQLSEFFVKVNQKMIREEVKICGDVMKTILVMESTLSKALYLAPVEDRDHSTLISCPNCSLTAKTAKQDSARAGKQE
uniref:caspase-14-like n=1 Tax=Pristiophorus japonicus TaxID=55135 RepID=UPI00398F1128